MQGTSSLSPSGPPRSPFLRLTRSVVTVLYRQAGLIAACVALGVVASSMVHARQARVHASALQGTSLGASADHRAAGTTSTPIRSRLAFARLQVLTAEERIVALLVRGDDPGARTGGAVAGYPSGATMDRGLRFDHHAAGSTRSPADSPAAPDAAAPTVPALDLPLRRDDGESTLEQDAAGMQDPARRAGSPRRPVLAVRENTPLEVELNRLERDRQSALERYDELQRSPDLAARLEPPRAGPRAEIDAREGAIAADPAKPDGLSLLGPLAGLSLGLLFAGVRELGGDRMRSRREAEWALGAPVLGVIPTLSARARNACLGPPIDTLSFAPSEFA